ncbi:MAG TPA: winged helix-turn-helix domain-containing protein, partial [Blastocatellia bacterium]
MAWSNRPILNALFDAKAMMFELDRDSHTPLYAQIACQIRNMITGGVLKIGDRIPANRELSRVLGVNRTTVNTAYQELWADG